MVTLNTLFSVVLPKYHHKKFQVYDVSFKQHNLYYKFIRIPQHMTSYSNQVVVVQRLMMYLGLIRGGPITTILDIWPTSFGNSWPQKGTLVCGNPSL